MKSMIDLTATEYSDFDNKHTNKQTHWTDNMPLNWTD